MAFEPGHGFASLRQSPSKLQHQARFAYPRLARDAYHLPPSSLDLTEAILQRGQFPLSTHQQLLSKKYDDAEFRASLGTAMGDAVQRISRLSNQMLFLARDSVLRSEPVPVGKVIEEAFHEAQKFVSPKPANLVYESGGQTPVVAGDRAVGA